MKPWDPDRGALFRDVIDITCERLPVRFEAPGEYSPGLLEPHEIDVGFVEYLRKASTKLIRKEGGVPPYFFVFGRRDPFTCEAKPSALYTVRITKPEAAEDDDVKNSLSLIVRGVAHAADARAVLHLSEAWLVQRTVPPGGKPEDSLKGQRARDQPDRKEVVQAMLDDGVTAHGWFADLHKYGRRGFHVGPFVKVPDGAKHGGRFAGMMGEPPL